MGGFLLGFTPSGPTTLTPVSDPLYGAVDVGFCEREHGRQTPLETRFDTLERVFENPHDELRTLILRKHLHSFVEAPEEREFLYLHGNL